MFYKGSLEVVVDRRATFDDGRGMGEGILDSVDTLHKYWLLLEPISPSKSFEKKSPNSKHHKSQEQNEPDQKPLSIATGLANFLSRRLNYPSIQYKNVNNGARQVTKGKTSDLTFLKDQIKLLSSKVTLTPVY